MVAKFLGTEDAMIVAMGFATNSTSLPSIVSRGSLVISDELNHSSIRFGSRLSGAMVKQYKHNDMTALEALLRETVSQGQPGRRRAWDKILVVVEGLYSMEGTLVNLPAILELKKKYKVRLFYRHLACRGAAISISQLERADDFSSPVLSLRRRGTLHWRSRTERAGSVRLLWRESARYRHPHGNFHQMSVISFAAISLEN